MEPAAQFDGQAAAEFLTSRIDYERATAVSYDPRDFCLDRMRELLDRLGNPQRGLPIIHIAGTKGKGSTAAMIASILRAAGFHTGLYSSPHLDSLEERLMVDGAICPADELVGLVNRVRPVVAAMDDAGGAGRGSKRPTYFEIVTALALLRFALCRVDAAVLEVGMGGRLDSTNVCDPLVSVITNISFDHTQQLGNTLAAIAREKAGIIKPDTPVVSGVLSDEPRQVVAEVARVQGCRLVQLGKDFDYTYRPPRNLNQASTWGHMDFHLERLATNAIPGHIELRSDRHSPGRQRGGGHSHACSIAATRLEHSPGGDTPGPGRISLARVHRSLAAKSNRRARRCPQRGIGRGAGAGARRRVSPRLGAVPCLPRREIRIFPECCRCWSLDSTK